jgi:type I restriction enzyme S subunit
MKAGYKQTDLGFLPKEWGLVSLGEMTTKVGSGITPTGGKRVYKTEGRPFLRSQNVGWGCLIMDDIAFIDEETHDSFKATEIENGDVFLNITGASIGRSAVADERVVSGNVNQHVCIIRPKFDQLDPIYLNYFILSRSGQKQIDSFQAGGNRQGLNFGQIRSFHLPLPPLSEQEAIAAALSDVDSLITTLDRLIAKKRDIKQAAMQELLTGKSRLPEFSGDWELKSLGSFCEITAGGDLVKDDFSMTCDHRHPFPIYSNALMSKGLYGYSKSYQYESDKITVTARGDIGHAFYRSKQFCAIGRLLVLSSKDLCNLRFVTEYINTFVNFAHESTGVPQLTAPQISKYAVALPPTKAEQTAIATILSDMDAEIAALEQKREKTRALKQGMMQELLTGRVRLV